MVAGHFGFAAIVKSRARATPLWALMLATQWLDVVFVPLFIAGIERIEPLPGTSGGYGQGIIFADYTHSLVGAAVLSIVFGAAAAWRWGSRAGGVLGAVSFSHWLIDLLVHRADMPLLPGARGPWPRLGFGLWRWPGVTAAMELALVVAGAALYQRAALDVAGDAPLRARARTAAFLLLVGGLVTLLLNLRGY